MDEKKHFFVIVNYNGGEHIIRCIHSILQSQNVHPLIIVVDNASTDQSLEQCKIKYPNLTYIYNTQNIGFAAAANIGTRYALERQACTITYCNPDAQLSKNCTHFLIDAVTNRDMAIVSPLIFDTTRKNTWFAGGVIDFWRFRATHTHTKNTPTSITPSDYISGCIMTVAAHVFAKIGLLDERFFLYYEDADFSLRARKNDLKIGIVPYAHAFHDEISEEHKDLKTYFLVLSGLLFFDKHARGINRLWFYINLQLRKLKNHHDRKKSQPLAQSVHKAIIDYASLT